MDRAQQRGWIRTILGRKCRFDMWEPATFGMHKPQTFDDACYGTRITEHKKSIYIQGIE
jgi:hypothetical protein